MPITAQLRDTVPLADGEALISGFAYESRGDQRRALLPNGHELEVYDLDALFAGDHAPLAVFALPWPAWDRGSHSVAPDGTFAAFSGQRAVRAVAADGRTLWEYRHGCWGPELGHPHTGDEQQVCDGLEHGSCRVSDDGRLVWAHIVSEPEPEQWQEVWVVLDARDGRELARLPLEESAASGSHHLSHPDGVHMGLEIGMGQDGILLHWARWDGTELTSWDLNATMDRILMDVHAEHDGFLTVEHYGRDVRLHALNGAVIAEGTPPDPQADDDPAYWDYVCGFVDAETVIASTTEATGDGARHCLLDARTLGIRGAIDYPTSAIDGFVRPLGDGTWITYDKAAQVLNRWAVAGM